MILVKEGMIMNSILSKIKTSVRSAILIFIALITLCINTTSEAKSIQIEVDSTSPGKPIKHVWSFWGFDECNFTYTENSRELMKTLSISNKDPVYIRSHFLLNTGDGTPALKWSSTNAYTENEAGTPSTGAY